MQCVMAFSRTWSAAEFAIRSEGRGIGSGVFRIQSACILLYQPLDFGTIFRLSLESALR